MCACVCVCECELVRQTHALSLDLSLSLCANAVVPQHDIQARRMAQVNPCPVDGAKKWLRLCVCHCNAARKRAVLAVEEHDSVLTPGGSAAKERPQLANGHLQRKLWHHAAVQRAMQHWPRQPQPA